MMSDETEIKKKKKKSPIPFIVIVVLIVIIAVAVVMMLRVQLLNKNLEAGAGYLADKKYSEAADAYGSALKIYPTSADAYLGLAEAYIGKGELTEAVTTLDKGITKTGSANLEKSRSLIAEQVYATYSLNEYLINIYTGDSFQMIMTNKSEDMGFETRWSVGDESVATIDDNGVISALKDGTTQVVAELGNEAWGYKDIVATLVVGKMTSYMEEQGCQYVSNPKMFELPAFTYQENEEGLRTEEGTLEIEQQDAVYEWVSCTAGDLEADGNIQYSVEYTVTVPVKIGIVPGSKEASKQWYYNWACAEMILVDDYTGQVFSEQSLYGQDGISYESEVNWNNLIFDISGNMTDAWEDNAEWVTTLDEESGITWAETTAVGTYRINVTVPKSYEGLLLVLDKRGKTDYQNPEFEDGYDPDETYVDSFFFDTLEDGTIRSVDDYYYIRLADVAK